MEEWLTQPHGFVSELVEAVRGKVILEGTSSVPFLSNKNLKVHSLSHMLS